MRANAWRGPQGGRLKASVTLQRRQRADRQEASCCSVISLQPVHLYVRTHCHASACTPRAADGRKGDWPGTQPTGKPVRPRPQDSEQRQTSLWAFGWRATWTHLEQGWIPACWVEEATLKTKVQPEKAPKAHVGLESGQ